MDKVGIAFAGGGLVAELHGRAVAACPNARFVGVFDPNREAAETRAAALGGKVYADLDELVADPAVDAVHILTPPEGHVPSTLAAHDTSRSGGTCLADRLGVSGCGVRRGGEASRGES